MIESVQFKNFKALRDATLPLGRFTLIVGPNGSGKSTALQALQALHEPKGLDYLRIVSAHQRKHHYRDPTTNVEITVNWAGVSRPTAIYVIWERGFPGTKKTVELSEQGVQKDKIGGPFNRILKGIRLYSLDAPAIAVPVLLKRTPELEESGAGLAGVLDQLRDVNPKRFEQLTAALKNWLPEYDQIVFEVADPGKRSFLLRTREGYRIAAADLSQGTLIALAILTLAYLPNPPSVACFEEPDRAVHPRLLRRVQDALYRLAYPESFGEKREPVQVIATTHNPYFLDLFKDHPEEVVIAEKKGLEGSFHRLVDLPHWEEILEGAQLGDVWYTGILGGVPAGT